MSVGVCDNETAVCHCTHNTHGHHCELCDDGYYGDPRSVVFMFLIIGGISHVACQVAFLQSLHSSFIMADISGKLIIFVNYSIISLHVVCAHVICAASFLPRCM